MSCEYITNAEWGREEGALNVTHKPSPPACRYLYGTAVLLPWEKKKSHKILIQECTGPPVPTLQVTTALKSICHACMLASSLAYSKPQPQGKTKTPVGQKLFPWWAAQRIAATQNKGAWGSPLILRKPGSCRGEMTTWKFKPAMTGMGAGFRINTNPEPIPRCPQWTCDLGLCSSQKMLK